MARLTSLLLLGAIGASAHPSGHARFHNKQRQVEDRDVGDIIHAVIDGVDVAWTQTQNYGPSETSASAAIVADKPHVNVNVASPTSSVVFATTLATTYSASFGTTISASAGSATPTATSSSSSSSATGSSSGSSAEGVTEFTTFADYCANKKKRATNAEIFYSGNTGEDNDYGCNIMLLGDASLASQYNNTVKFFGGSSDMYCLAWNKIGKDGGVNGFFGAGATTFTLPAGGEQYVALDANSQGGGACVQGSASDILKTAYGAIAMTWVEWDAENSSNNGWSGADASCIVAQKAGLSVTGLEVCLEGDSSTCSSIAADAASVVNAYTADLADADGIGLQADGGLKITVNVGY